MMTTTSSSPIYTTQKLRLDQLQIDPTYQRGVVEASVRRMAKEWEEEKAGAIVVGRRVRDNQYYIVDGQQRTEGLRRAGGQEILANIFNSMGPSHEAQMFLALNDDRSKVGSYYIFRSRVLAKDPVAVMVARIVQEEGFEMHKPGKGRISWPGFQCHATLLKVGEKGDGEETLRKLLQLIRECWQGDVEALRIQVVSGLALFLRKYGEHEHFNIDKLREILRRELPAQLMAQTRVMISGGGGGNGIAGQFAENLKNKYNGKKRVRILD